MMIYLGGEDLNGLQILTYEALNAALRVQGFHRPVKISVDGYSRWFRAYKPDGMPDDAKALEFTIGPEVDEIPCDLLQQIAMQKVQDALFESGQRVIVWNV